MTCKDCKHLMFSDCYGECAAAYKGIVQPWDTCEHWEGKQKLEGKMTNEEALKYTDTIRLTYADEKEGRANVDFILAVRDALKKQIPKEQDKHFIENKFGFFCCKETGKTIRYPLVSFTDLEFCPRCGQAIDWEGIDNESTDQPIIS